MMRHLLTLMVVALVTLAGTSHADPDCDTSCSGAMCSTCCPAYQDGVKGECCTLKVAGVVESTCCTFKDKVSCK